MADEREAVRTRDPASPPRAPETSRRTPMFAPFPREGFWTALGMTRGQYFGILLASCLVFLFWGHPLWRHLGGAELPRIAISYAIIPAAVTIALWWNGKLRFSLFLGATVTIALLKLVATAGIDLALGIALGTR
ncbi:MAG TPA: hypothetical protein VFD92_16630 [Candidatus Binatia bacterium]|nr:hypothetical protein [Candidatus Binatia bacterium]